MNTSDAKPHIAVFTPNGETRKNWVNELTKALPGYQIDDQPRPDSRYAVVWSPESDFFESTDQLRACFSMGAGVDSLLSNTALPTDVPLYRLEDAGMGVQMARYCRHEVEHFRLMHYKYQQQQLAQQWTEHYPLPPEQVPIGLFGYGVLGKQVAHALLAEGHPVHAFRRQASGDDESVKVYAGQDQFNAFLAASAVLILIAPLTEQTRGAINAAAIDALPDNAYLINVGRGALVNEADLVNALQREKLAGATLDVFSTEPLPTDSPVWKTPNLRITPHISAQTLLKESVRQIAEKIVTIERGEQPSGLVARNNGY